MKKGAIHLDYKEYKWQDREGTEVQPDKAGQRLLSIFKAPLMHNPNLKYL